MPLPEINHLLNRMSYLASFLVITVTEKDEAEDIVKKLDRNTECPLPPCRLP